MAEARQAVTRPRVFDLQEGKDARQDFFKALKKSLIKKFFQVRNQISNGLWPTSLWNLGAAVGFLSLALVQDWAWSRPLWRIGHVLHIDEDVPYSLRVFLVSSVSGFIFFFCKIYVRRYMLRGLLAYRNWMYQPLHHVPVSTMLWSVLVRLVSGWHPRTFSYQKSLPRMPVPPLKATLKGLIESLKPLYGEDSMQIRKLKEQSKEFEKKLGQRLQHILVLKSWWDDNYVTEWWNKYVYLMGRGSIAINSNYYAFDQCNFTGSEKQAARAGNVAWHILDFIRSIQREEMVPLVIRKTVPLCMAQYERFPSTTRIPGEDCDELVSFSSAKSKHLVVSRKGLYYKVDLLDVHGQPLGTQALEHQFHWIIEDADLYLEEHTDTEKSLASLTGLERTDWARIRKEQFSSGVNKESLDMIESAVFLVVLETQTFEHSDLSRRGKALLHNDGKTLWFDKSLTLVVFSDGKCGLNCEHSWGDAPVVAHCMEHITTNEALYHKILFDENGHCANIPHNLHQVALKVPSRLLWDVNPRLTAHVDRAIKFNQKNNDDLDLVVKEHTDFGKGFIKKCKVSPDAFIQAAIQLTYYKDSQGQFGLTYESTMTRLYLEGRTETVRSLTKELAAFVRAMMQEDVSSQEKIRLLRVACDRHQLLYRNAMNGKAIDRHLFALYVLAKGLGHENDFLKSVLSLPWTLSTSQQPQQQMANSPNANKPEYQPMLSPGGGFGPVSDDGYGVSYMVPGDFKMFFHVTSKRSSSKTSSERFMNLLFQSFAEMKALFNEQEN